MSNRRILLTGCTGLLGGGLLAALLDKPRYERLYILLRSGNERTARQRFDALIQELFPPQKQPLAREKLRLVVGDLTQPGLGVSADDRTALVTTLHQILHSGASTRFHLPLAELRQVNCEGTRALLDLAREARAKGPFARFDFVSTAYVAGTKPGDVSEADLERGQTFSNNYEQSKYETERMIRQVQQEVDFPITMYRPSVVVGRSDNGYTPHFRTMYWPMKMLARGVVPIIPIEKNAVIDVVPCDYVVHSIIALMHASGTQGQTFHLTAGKGNEITIGDMVNDIFAAGVAKKRPVMPIGIFHRLQGSVLWYLFPASFRRLVERARPYRTYLEGTGVRFLNETTRQRLNELGVSLPKWDDYKANIFAFAVASDWGETQAQPAYHYLHDASLDPERLA